jgi:hypothetical protein
MEAFRRCAQALALLPIYMVAGSYWCPTLLAGGLRYGYCRSTGLGAQHRVRYDRCNQAYRWWVSAVPRGAA